MKASEIVMNIAVNLVRIARFASDDRQPRVRQFVNETQEYLDQLDKTQVGDQFESTLIRFKENFGEMKNVTVYSEDYIDDLHTWANILAARAELA